MDILKKMHDSFTQRYEEHNSLIRRYVEDIKSLHVPCTDRSFLFDSISHIKYEVFHSISDDDTTRIFEVIGKVYPGLTLYLHKSPFNFEFAGQVVLVISENLSEATVRYVNINWDDTVQDLVLKVTIFYETLLKRDCSDLTSLRPAHCTSCGAPLKKSTSCCSYCGTEY